MENNIKQIGERLKGLREIFNISAEEVAELCEVSLEHYLKIEAGEADPSVYRLSRISKRYGIDLDAEGYHSCRTYHRLACCPYRSHHRMPSRSFRLQDPAC